MKSGRLSRDLAQQNVFWPRGVSPSGLIIQLHLFSQPLEGALGFRRGG
jgi:hypothetical protein